VTGCALGALTFGADPTIQAGAAPDDATAHFWLIAFACGAIAVFLTLIHTQLQERDDDARESILEQPIAQLHADTATRFAEIMRRLDELEALLGNPSRSSSPRKGNVWKPPARRPVRKARPNSTTEI
jgi:hypothetical protein